MNSAKSWLSYDLVRFKIELGVGAKFNCKNATKQCANSYGEAVNLLQNAYTSIRTDTPRHGDNMLVGFKVELANTLYLQGVLNRLRALAQFVTSIISFVVEIHNKS